MDRSFKLPKELEGKINLVLLEEASMRTYGDKHFKGLNSHPIVVNIDLANLDQNLISILDTSELKKTIELLHDSLDSKEIELIKNYLMPKNLIRRRIAPEISRIFGVEETYRTVLFNIVYSSVYMYESVIVE